MASGEIDDAKPSHGNSDGTVDVDAFIIWTSVDHGGTHLTKDRGFGANSAPEFHDAGNATHGIRFSLVYATEISDREV